MRSTVHVFELPLRRFALALAATIAGVVCCAWAAPAGAQVYWTNVNAGTIGRASLDGSSANQSFITGANSPAGVAVDRVPTGTASPSATGLSFGTQPLGVLGAPKALTITNTESPAAQVTTS